MAQSSSSHLTQKVLFFQKLKGTEKWYVYWLVEEEILGIMSGINYVFEKKMTNLERRSLLKNIADSLLTSRWIQVFNERSLNFEIENDKATINYITNSTELPFIQSETERSQKIMKFLHQICSDYKAIEVCFRFHVPKTKYGNFRKNLSTMKNEKKLKNSINKQENVQHILPMLKIK